MSRDKVKREDKAKQDIGSDGLIQDAEEQIASAKERIEKLKDCILFFKERKHAESATGN